MKTLMRRGATALLCFALAVAGTAGQSASRIELIDGTEIIGDVLSFSDGRYLIESATLGRLRLEESSIRSIAPAAVGAAGDVAPSAQLESLQVQILRSPEVMELVGALRSDPQIQAVLSDRELMQMVLSGNLEALRRDPRILRLGENPSVRAIVDKINSQ